ncbi:hypothetical protein AVEN_139888-1 [Araneus ventricosus]|uniref:Uncharacterized protein n=1 Tax=Araneus ventricosus TaxID=182803 RepID=A0A4Y2FS58_ARAVE|nr:hypothetical protein AVEN_139888-1 [Araneus ventricosus]
MNAFSQSEIEHFDYCDDDSITSDAPSDEDIVFLMKEKNDLIEEASSDESSIKSFVEGDAISGLSNPDVKAIVNICKLFLK